MRTFLKCSILGTLLTMSCRNISGQDIQRYSPQRPTVSPYLNLLRNDNGSVPNYYSLVRPQQNQQSFDRQIASATRLQSLSIQRLEEVAQMQTTRSTGTGSVYRNLSHFYPAKRTASGRRR